MSQNFVSVQYTCIMSLDVISLLSTARCIESRSKTEIIELVSSFDERVLKHILITTICEIKPNIKQLVMTDFDAATVKLYIY